MIPSVFTVGQGYVDIGHNVDRVTSLNTPQLHLSMENTAPNRGISNQPYNALREIGEPPE